MKWGLFLKCLIILVSFSLFTFCLIILYKEGYLIVFDQYFNHIKKERLSHKNHKTKKRKKIIGKSIISSQDKNHHTTKNISEYMNRFKGKIELPIIHTDAISSLNIS